VTVIASERERAVDAAKRILKLSANMERLLGLSDQEQSSRSYASVDAVQGFFETCRSDAPGVARAYLEAMEALEEISAMADRRRIPGGEIQAACGHLGRAVRVARRVLVEENGA
jgi:hypothetical protein